MKNEIDEGTPSEKKMSEFEMNASKYLESFIDDNFFGNKALLASTLGLTRSQVTRWVKTGQISVMSALRMQELVDADATKLNKKINTKSLVKYAHVLKEMRKVKSEKSDK